GDPESPFDVASPEGASLEEESIGDESEGESLEDESVDPASTFDVSAPPASAMPPPSFAPPAPLAPQPTATTTTATALQPDFMSDRSWAQLRARARSGHPAGDRARRAVDGLARARVTGRHGPGGVQEVEHEALLATAQAVGAAHALTGAQAAVLGHLL